MIVSAHVGRVPLEELLPPRTGAGVGLMVARGWMKERVRRAGGRHELMRCRNIPAPAAVILPIAIYE